MSFICNHLPFLFLAFNASDLRVPAVTLSAVEGCWWKHSSPDLEVFQFSRCISCTNRSRDLRFACDARFPYVWNLSAPFV